MEHPLLQTEIKNIKTWAEWKKLWDETPFMELRHSLLHFGFEIRGQGQDWHDRVLFYLSVADGWPYASSFAAHDESCESRGCQNRRKLARKAFEVLCLNCFKEDTQEGRWQLDRGLDGVGNRPLIEGLLSFFYGTHAYSDGERRLKNLAYEDHHSQTARDFLIRLIKHLWHVQEPESCIHFRPTFVEILDGLERLDLLLTMRLDGCRPDEACLNKLEEIALRSKDRFLGKEGRHPNTIEEAVWAGSKAARTLLILRTAQKEQYRLHAIHDLERVKQETERELEKLKPL